jgi:hypothetical protein
MRQFFPLRTLTVVAVLAAGAVVTAPAQTETTAAAPTPVSDTLRVAQEKGTIEVVGGTSFDWGTVAPGELTTVIEVRNLGPGDVKITEVRPSCGCTVAPIDKNLLHPGEVGKISVKLDARTRFGQQHKVITVMSDATNPQQVITLTANVKPVVQVTPVNYFLINDAPVGVEQSSALKLKNASEKPMTIFPPTLEDGNVKIRFNLTKKKDLKPGEEIELTAYITPLAAGAINGKIHVKTSTKEEPVKELSIYGTATAKEATHSDAGTAGHSHK